MKAKGMEMKSVKKSPCQSGNSDRGKHCESKCFLKKTQLIISEKTEIMQA